MPTTPSPTPYRPLNYGITVLHRPVRGNSTRRRQGTVRHIDQVNPGPGKCFWGVDPGVVPYDNTAADSPLIIESHATSIRVEALRQQRTDLQFIDVDQLAKVVVITSSVANEGKSSTATNLAVIFSEAGKKVLLIGGDLRRPRVVHYLGVEGAVGLSNLLAGQAKLDGVLQPWGRGGLTVLPSGSEPPNPSELLQSQQMTTLLQSMRTEFDMILIDTPPVLPVTDGAIMAARADGALLVVHHGTTKKQRVAAVVSALDKVQARPLSCVLNMAPTKGADADGYGYGYGYGGYQQYASPAPSRRPPPTEEAATESAGDPTTAQHTSMPVSIPTNATASQVAANR